MPPAGFEPAFPASERPPTHALDGAANEIGFERIKLYTNTVTPQILSSNEYFKPAFLKLFPSGDHFH